MKRETIMYRGKKYHRYPESKTRSTRIYFTRGRYKKGSISLHRQKWIDHRGPIPKGMVIHHKDGNSSNNKISNLEMLLQSVHQANHMTPERRKISAKTIKINATFGRKWLSTSEGREFHKKKSIKYWENPTRYNRICEKCKEGFNAFKSTTRFCSKNCMQRAYRMV